MLAKKLTNPKQQNKIFMSAEKPQTEGKKFWEFKNYLNKENKKEADLLLYGVVGEDGFWGEVTAKDFAEDLKEVEDAETINVRINSPGGDVFAGQAIYSMLKRCKSKIVVYIDGLAASIASLVAMAGDTVIMPKNSMMMIHKPWTFAAGNANDMRQTADTLDKVEESILVAYTDKTGLSKEEISTLLEAETWLSATEAKEKGFCDEIEETEIKASLKDGFLTINNQKFNIKDYKNFNTSWYDKGHKDDGQRQDPAGQSVPKVQNTFITVVQNNQMKGKKIMDLEKLCAACGLDYNALIKAGMTDAQIKAMVSAQMQADGQNGNGGNDAEDAQNQVKAEKQRVKDIAELGKLYNASEKAMQYIADGKSVEQFKDELLKGVETKEQKPLNTSSFGIGMTLEEAKNFSIVNLVNALAYPNNRAAQDAAEKEFNLCAKAAEKYGAKNKGTVIPVEALLAPMISNLDTTGGAALIPTTLKTESFIELLRNKCVLMQLSRQLNGLVGNIEIPKQTAGTSGSWVGEDVAADASNPEFGVLKLGMKTVTANSYVTRSMLKQTTMDIEQMVREDLATALALAIDKAGFYGTGSENQPKGITKIDGVNTVEYTGNFPSYNDFVDMETEIATDNADVESMAYIVNAKTRGNCKKTQKFPDNTDGGGVIWQDGKINDYKAVCTNQINDGDTILGNFADFIIGLFGGLEIIVDPYTKSTQGGVRITAFQDVDFGPRHEESFCVAKKSA